MPTVLVFRLALFAEWHSALKKLGLFSPTLKNISQMNMQWIPIHPPVYLEALRFLVDYFIASDISFLIKEGFNIDVI